MLDIALSTIEEIAKQQGESHRHDEDDEKAEADGQTPPKMIQDSFHEPAGSLIS